MRAEERHYYSTARMRVVKSWVSSSTSVVEQMMKARVEKSRIMDRMKKMAEETRKEMEVVEAMKKQL